MRHAWSPRLLLACTVLRSSLSPETIRTIENSHNAFVCTVHTSAMSLSPRNEMLNIVWCSAVQCKRRNRIEERVQRIDVVNVVVVSLLGVAAFGRPGSVFEHSFGTLNELQRGTCLSFSIVCVCEWAHSFTRSHSIRCFGSLTFRNCCCCCCHCCCHPFVQHVLLCISISFYDALQFSFRRRSFLCRSPRRRPLPIWLVQTVHRYIFRDETYWQLANSHWRRERKKVKIQFRHCFGGGSEWRECECYRSDSLALFYVRQLLAEQ